MACRAPRHGYRCPSGFGTVGTQAENNEVLRRWTRFFKPDAAFDVELGQRFLERGLDGGRFIRRGFWQGFFGAFACRFRFRFVDYPRLVAMSVRRKPGWPAFHKPSPTARCSN